MGKTHRFILKFHKFILNNDYAKIIRMPHARENRFRVPRIAVNSFCHLKQLVIAA